MNKFSKFMASFSKIARLIVYFFLIINLCLDLVYPGHLLSIDIVWWVTYLILDTWYNLVVKETETETKTCNCNCKSYQKLNS